MDYGFLLNVDTYWVAALNFAGDFEKHTGKTALSVPCKSSATPRVLWVGILEYMSRNVTQGLRNLCVNNKSFTKIRQNSNDNYNERRNRI